MTTTIPGLPSYVLPALESGTQWPVGSPSTTITYTFWQATPAYDTDTSENTGFMPFTATMIAAVHAVQTEISDIANITFQMVTDPGRSNESGQAAIEIGYGSADIDIHAEAYTYYPDPHDPNGGDVWANQVWFTQDQYGNSDPTASHVQPGDYDWMTLFHETGHAVGLKHPFNDHSGDPPFFLPNNVESDQYSIMSYTQSPDYEWKDTSGVTHDLYPETYMPYDIATIQALYGVNTTYNTGNDDYVLNPDHIYTIYDAGGNDTMDGSALSTNEVISLVAGGYSTINEDTPITNNIAIAFGVTIENALGGSGNDTIYDNSADNSIDGGAGDDTINLSSGNDTVTGNTGNDVIFGGRGNDTLDGGIGDDTIYAGIGNDTITGGAGNDTIFGGTGNDLIDGGGGADVVVLSGKESAWSSDGSGDITNGTDTYTLGNVGTLEFSDGTLDGGDLALTDQILTISGSAHTLTGGLASDTLTGGTGNDTLFGLSGNDTLDGGAGIDTLEGGTGNDTYIIDVVVASGVAKLQDIVTDTLGTNTIVLRAGDLSGQMTAHSTFTLGTGVANMDASQTSANDAFNLTGNTGNNVLTANGHGDTLDGGGGVDTLIGGAGNDTFIIENAVDSITGGGGTDSVIAKYSVSTETNVNLSTFSNVHILTVTGTGLFDLTGTTGDDVMTGNKSNNILVGNGGNDTLDGGGGVDQLRGGAGNDTYIIENAADTITDTGGNNTVIDAMTSGTYTLTGLVNTLILSGTASISGTGNANADTITGNAGNNILNDGGGAADTLTGGAGNDTYIVSNASDVIVEGLNAGTDLIQSSVSLTLAANVEKLTLTGSANIDGTGNSGNNVIVGNGGDNTLDGGGGVDTLQGGGGNDTYVVDVIASGTVAKMEDVVTDTLGSNEIILRAGNLGLAGASTLTLATGIAKMDASQTDANDFFNLTGNAAGNVLIANNHGDTLNGLAGVDTLIGGTGNDTFIIANAADIVTSGGGTDTIVVAYNTSVAATLNVASFTGVENLTVTGTGLYSLQGDANDNALTGNASNNTLTGGGGNDTLDGGGGVDTLIGGAGNDTYVIENAADVIQDTGGNNEIVDKMASGTYTLATGFDSLVLSGTAALGGTGNAGADTITGNTGANVLNDGGGAADTLAGGAGNDTYFVNNSSDVIIEGVNAGTDVVMSTVSFSLAANIEKLTLTGAANIDGTGNSGNNTIVGNTGDNTLDGGGGVDTLQGGMGNDTYIVDVIVAGAVAKFEDVVTDTVGTNEIILRAGDLGLPGATTFTLATGITNMDASQTDANDAFNLTGNTANNVLTANDHGDTLNGMAGVDTLIGGAGNDTFIVGNAGDLVTGNGGTDTVLSSVTYSLAPFADVHVLTLTGTAALNATANDAGDTLTGNSGANSLTGGAGNDTLIGGLGHDILTGGAGVDTFVYHHTETASAANSDTIRDFTPGSGGDVIDISDVLAGHYSSGPLAGFVRLTDDGHGGTNLSVNAAGTGSTFILVADLSNVSVASLTDADHMVTAGNLIV